MSEPVIEQHDGPPPDAANRYECPDCGETFAMAMHLGSHRKAKHGYTAPSRPKRKRTGSSEPRPRSSEPRPRSNAARLHRDLAAGAKAVAMLPLLRNPQVLGDVRVVDMIDRQADEFASAWVAVAEKDARVAKWLNTLLTGSVWINAGVSSVTFVYSVSVFSGLAPLHPALTMVMPDLAQFVVPTSVVPTPAAANGDGPHES